jgi:hypothetical protein
MTRYPRSVGPARLAQPLHENKCVSLGDRQGWRHRAKMTVADVISSHATPKGSTRESTRSQWGRERYRRNHADMPSGGSRDHHVDQTRASGRPHSGARRITFVNREITRDGRASPTLPACGCGWVQEREPPRGQRPGRITSRCYRQVAGARLPRRMQRSFRLARASRRTGPPRKSPSLPSRIERRRSEHE